MALNKVQIIWDSVKILAGVTVGLCIGAYDYPIKTALAGDSLCAFTATRDAGSSRLRVIPNRDIRVIDQSAAHSFSVTWDGGNEKVVPNTGVATGKSIRGYIVLTGKATENNKPINAKVPVLIEISNILGSYRFVQPKFCGT